MELLQLQADEGPCLDCYRDATQIQIPDLAAVADRWPCFAATTGRSRRCARSRCGSAARPPAR